MFDSVTKAIQYLRDSVNLLWNSKATLENRLLDIEQTIQKAQQAQDQTAIGKLIVLKTQTQELLKQREEFWNQLNPFRSYFSSSELGVIPVALIGGGIALASALYLFFEKVRNQGTALEMIKQGILTPEQATGLVGGGVLGDLTGLTKNLGTVLLFGGMIYALFLFGPTISKAVKR